MAFREEAGILPEYRGENKRSEERGRGSPAHGIAHTRAVGFPALAGGAGRVVGLIERGADTGAEDVSGRDGLVDEDLEFTAGRERPGISGDIGEDNGTAGDVADETFICSTGLRSVFLLRLRGIGFGGRRIRSACAGGLLRRGESRDGECGEQQREEAGREKRSAKRSL